MGGDKPRPYAWEGQYPAWRAALRRPFSIQSHAKCTLTVLYQQALPVPNELAHTNKTCHSVDL